jgi:hypothetical protein
MKQKLSNNITDQILADLGRLWKNQHDRFQLEKILQALDARYDLNRKIAKEPSVAEIIEQMAGRLANSYPGLVDIQNKRILDIACGSNTSKLPASLNVNTPFGEMTFDRVRQGYTTLFEPWFCRFLFELGAMPVGVDFGDLEQEPFIHHRVDLGKAGALDFLPDNSFDGIQDSRLFGSPEFTAQFPRPADRLKVAEEINRQEQRLLKPDGIIIHSDAAALVK